jgi:hypothetical protein
MEPSESVTSLNELLKSEELRDQSQDVSLVNRACSLLHEYESLLLEWMKWMASLTSSINNPSVSMTLFTKSPVFNTFLQRFRTQQEAWTRVLCDLETHQRRHSEILELYHNLKSYDAQRKSIATSLMYCQVNLENAISDIEDKFKLLQIEPIPLSELLSYSRKVAYTSSAPPRWDPSMPLRMTQPPAPQEDAMRTGHLYRHSLHVHKP